MDLQPQQHQHQQQLSHQMLSSLQPLAQQQQEHQQQSSTKKPRRKRRVLLDEESERQIKEEEREEFVRVLQDQYSKVDMSTIHTLPEVDGDRTLTYERDNSWEYWMSIMLQYQMCRSFVHYTDDSEEQQKQMEWQKEMRFQLMQKKRAIKREKRRMFKLKKNWDTKRKLDDSDLSNPAAKRAKLDQYAFEDAEDDDDSLDLEDSFEGDFDFDFDTFSSSTSSANNLANVTCVNPAPSTNSSAIPSFNFTNYSATTTTTTTTVPSNSILNSQLLNDYNGYNQSQIPQQQQQQQQLPSSYALMNQPSSAYIQQQQHIPQQYNNYQYSNSYPLYQQ